MDAMEILEAFSMQEEDIVEGFSFTSFETPEEQREAEQIHRQMRSKKELFLYLLKTRMNEKEREEIGNGEDEVAQKEPKTDRQEECDGDRADRGVKNEEATEEATSSSVEGEGKMEEEDVRFLFDRNCPTINVFSNAEPEELVVNTDPKDVHLDYWNGHHAEASRPMIKRLLGPFRLNPSPVDSFRFNRSPLDPFIITASPVVPFRVNSSPLGPPIMNPSSMSSFSMNPNPPDPFKINPSPSLNGILNPRQGYTWLDFVVDHPTKRLAAPLEPPSKPQRPKAKGEIPRQKKVSKPKTLRLTARTASEASVLHVCRRNKGCCKTDRYSETQLDQMQRSFDVKNRPSQGEIRNLAARISLRPENVKDWFFRRRNQQSSEARYYLELERERRRKEHRSPTSQENEYKTTRSGRKFCSEIDRNKSKSLVEMADHTYSMSPYMCPEN